MSKSGSCRFVSLRKRMNMKLYERSYYEEVIKMCQARIDAIDYLHEQTLKIYNNET